MKILFAVLKYLFLVLVVSTVVGSIIGVVFFMYFSQGLPNIITTEDYKPLTVTRILGKGDVVVGEYFDPEGHRYVVPIERIPKMTQKAFIAAEDDRFLEHQGIDLQGIIRAAIANFRAGRVVQGGSTITQQVAKSLLLTPERSFFRKLKEVILANRMEKNLSKNQILYLYLNEIYLGQGAYGVEAAARVYFNKESKDLTLAEAAILAGLPQAPSKYSPVSNPKQAKQRQQYVLRRLMEDGTITAAQMEEAVKQPVRIFLPADLNDRYAPYYVEHVRKHLLEKLGKDNLYRMGLTVRTPIEPTLAATAARAVTNGLRVVDKRQGYRGPILKAKTPTEIEAALSDIAEYNVTRKFPYQLLMPDGTHAKDVKSRMGAGKTEMDALDEENLYQALVMGVDDSKREAFVNLGFVKGVIPLEKMRWAQPVKAPSSTGLESIARPSQALAKGDVIWVKYAGAAAAKAGAPVFSLEQIPLVQGALLSMDANTGEVLSMVGGYDFKESEFNRAIQAERQPGSTFKAMIYSAAMDKGYTPATIIQDSPVVFSAGENEKWKPENFEEKFYGDTLFRAALVHSRNIPTIKIVQDIQVPYLIDYAVRLGFPDKFNRDLSIALGSSTVSLLDLTKAYAVFPRGGRRVQPIFIHKITDRDGKILEENAPTPPPPPLLANLAAPPRPVSVAGELQMEQNSGKPDPNRGVWTPDPADPDRVMDPRTAYVMTHLMNEVATVGTGHEAKNLGRPAAGKTGTTSDYIDAWFMGFTPQLVSGVWVGFDAQKTIGPRAVGGLIALPIWLEYMKEAVKPYPEADFLAPKGVNFAFIDGKTGKPTSANRPNAIREAFIEGTEPGATPIPQAPQSAQASPAGGDNTAQSTPTPAAVKDAPGETSSGQFFKEDIQ